MALIAAALTAFGVAVLLALNAGGDPKSVEVTPADTSPVTDPGETDGPSDGLTVTAADGSMSITWERVDGILADQITSDGNTFFALVAEGDDRQLMTSDDGTTWQAVATLPGPNTDDDKIVNGKVLRTTAQPDGSITVQVASTDGTITESTTEPVALERHRPFFDGANTTIAPIGSDGLLLSGSYNLDEFLIVAAGQGVPIDEIAAVGRDDRDDRPYMELMAEAFGVSVEEYERWNESEYGGFASATAIGVEGPRGDVTVELSSVGLEPNDCCQPLFFQFISVDGEIWTRLGPDAPRIAEAVEIDGGIAARVVGPAFSTETLAVSSDGVEWTTVLDDTESDGVAIGGTELIAANGRALWLSESNRSPKLWEVTAVGAVEIAIDDPEHAQLFASAYADLMSHGGAGIALLTSSTGGQLWDENFRLDTLLVSINNASWAALRLPEQLDVNSCCEALAVGAEGIVLRSGRQTWLGTIEPNT